MNYDVNTIKTLLPLYGYTASSDDNALITLCIQRVELYVLSWCNIKTIPPSLIPEMIDMVLGEFLYTKMNLGDLTEENMNFQRAITSITEGDTTVSWQNKNKSDFDYFLNLVDTMRKGRKGILEHYRKLHW